MNMIDLQGYHILTGVDYLPSIRTEDDDFEMYINDALFCLDGITYLMTESAEDTYRSNMTRLEVTDRKVRYTFPAQPVECRYDGGMGTDDVDKNDILEIYSLRGKLILRIGTEMFMDYYPLAVFEYHPENMSINGEDDRLM